VRSGTFRPGLAASRACRACACSVLVHARRRPRSAPCAGVRVSAREPEHDARRRVLQRTCDSLAVDVSERYRERFVTEQATLQIGGPELRWETLKEMRLGVRVVWHMRDTARHLRIFGMFYAVLRNRSSSATLCTWSPSPDLLWPDRDGVTWRELDLA